MGLSLNLKTVPGRYAIARLKPDADIPDWVNGPGFVSTSRADDELTVVCLEDRIPSGTEIDGDWTCLRSIGPFEFGAAGIVYSLIGPLSTNGIGVFVICTFDGEHMLISAKDTEKAMALLVDAGHNFDANAA